MLKVIIAAPPRSGSSFLAGLLVRMGFSPGPIKLLKKSDQNNPFGYYECLPLLKLSDKILAKFGGDFFENIPNLSPGWIKSECIKEEKQEILDLVNTGNIEVIKDARLLILSDLYHELFPDSKWLVIIRDIHETYQSRFGKKITFEQWRKITETRLSCWNKSLLSLNALKMDYQDFFSDFSGTIEHIEAFLSIHLSKQQKMDCLTFFKPGERRKYAKKFKS